VGSRIRDHVPLRKCRFVENKTEGSLRRRLPPTYPHSRPTRHVCLGGALARPCTILVEREREREREKTLSGTMIINKCRSIRKSVHRALGRRNSPDMTKLGQNWACITTIPFYTHERRDLVTGHAISPEILLLRTQNPLGVDR
jgi:hypothetical protein